MFQDASVEIHHEGGEEVSGKDCEAFFICSICSALEERQTSCSTVHCTLFSRASYSMRYIDGCVRTMESVVCYVKGGPTCKHRPYCGGERGLEMRYCTEIPDSRHARKHLDVHT